MKFNGDERHIENAKYEVPLYFDDMGWHYHHHHRRGVESTENDIESIEQKKAEQEEQEADSIKIY